MDQWSYSISQVTRTKWLILHFLASILGMLNYLQSFILIPLLYKKLFSLTERTLPFHCYSLNVLYTCTENIEQNGLIIAYTIGIDGELTKLSSCDAGGTSTCYLTIDRDQKNLLAVNYWDSTIVTIPLSPQTGEFVGEISSKYDPKQGKGMVAAAKKNGGANHSNNDESTIKQRQADPHSHAVVLDPYCGCIAFVPCLGKDLVREFFYDNVNGKIQQELNYLPSGLCTGHPDGPRYLEFHPKHNIMYVVNELSSTVSQVML
jgi:6-phosphogluconolactonase (cycloisomerase 2 family)